MKKSLNEIYGDAEAELKAMLDKIIGEVVAEHIPFAETDYDMNVYYRAQDLIQCFLTDQEPKGWMKSEIFTMFNSREVRDKMFEDYREQLVAEINQDRIREIKQLKNKIETLEEYLYNAYRGL